MKGVSMVDTTMHAPPGAAGLKLSLHTAVCIGVACIASLRVQSLMSCQSRLSGLHWEQKQRMLCIGWSNWGVQPIPGPYLARELPTEDVRCRSAHRVCPVCGRSSSEAPLHIDAHVPVPHPMLHMLS